MTKLKSVENKNQMKFEKIISKKYLLIKISDAFSASETLKKYHNALQNCFVEKMIMCVFKCLI